MNNILISAGDAITAKLIQEADFNGIWISGFEASARLGLKDNGSITMTEMLNVVRPIVRSVKIPVFVDCDIGYGNLQRTVDEFSFIGVSGVCTV
jgi:2-methylisocitrate lyase-like PEP mutase family enzyme